MFMRRQRVFQVAFFITNLEYVIFSCYPKPLLPVKRYSFRMLTRKNLNDSKIVPFLTITFQDDPTFYSGSLQAASVVSVSSKTTIIR